MAFDGETFMKQFMHAWNAHDVDAITVEGCDILTLRNGKISAKRSYRKSTL